MRYTRHNAFLTATAACVTPILYLLFINHFAVNALLFDDWRIIPFIHAALHGNLSLGQLWSQYGEPRLPWVKLDLLFFSEVVRLNTRWAIFFSAAVVIVGYAFLLALFRRYLARPLTPVPVLIVGAVWFSLANTQGALLSTSNGIFVVFGFITMLFALLVPQRPPSLWVVVAIVAAVFSTLGAVQGFIVWPIGAVCILWCMPKTRRMKYELGSWAGAFVVMASIYLTGYNRKLTSCYPGFGCVPTSAIHHPAEAVRYFTILIGNVIPGAFTSNQPGVYFGPTPTSVIRFEIVGVVLLAAAVFIIIQSWRQRTARERLPLPFLLITFSLLYDASITWGRVGEGLAGPVINNRYALPNLVLLTGITMYAWARLPAFRLPTSRDSWRVYASWASLLTLAIVLTTQVVVATDVGLTAARNTRAFAIDGARLVTNLNRVPVPYRECELVEYLITPADVADAADDHLGEFGPSALKHYRAMGPPALLPACAVGH